jgi:histidine ammonia-lyase
LFEADESMSQTKFDKRIQEYYSIRCVPQIIGPIYDAFQNAHKVVEDEINSTSDNPIVSVEDNNVYHGGNFHGDYISFEMDKLKICITKLSVLSERQLNFLLNHRLNKQFPPFLNNGKLGLNFGLQGVQYVATSTVAENQSLCNSVYVHSIPNNNDNQDVVSMGTNSAVICRKVVENTAEVIAVNLIAICNAIDIDKENDLIANVSSETKAIYNQVRKIISFVDEDVSISEQIRELAKYLLTNNITNNG